VATRRPSITLADEVHHNAAVRTTSRRPPKKEAHTGMTPNDFLQLVAVTPSTSDVRLRAGANAVSIGTVSATNGRWFWQHRDGEQSSPIAANRTDAAHALAHYHRTFKPTHTPPRRLLFT
jgi:hypothetical protein